AAPRVVSSVARSIRPTSPVRDRRDATEIGGKDSLGHGTSVAPSTFFRGRKPSHSTKGETDMNSVIYLVGLVVVVLAILAFFGLRGARDVRCATAGAASGRGARGTLRRHSSGRRCRAFELFSNVYRKLVKPRS